MVIPNEGSEHEEFPVKGTKEPLIFSLRSLVTFTHTFQENAHTFG
jgi:hypothetical protein